MRVYNTCTRPGCGRVLGLRCCAAAYCLTGRCVRLEFILELVSRILRRCVYGMAFGICSPSGSPLYVCACMCLCTAVGMCSPSGIPFVVSICMRACTAFGTYGSSGVLIAQKCACVGLHGARRVPAKFGCCVSLRGESITRERCGTCTPYVYRYSIRHGPPNQCTYCT